MATPEQVRSELLRIGKDLPENVVKTVHKMGDKIRDEAKTKVPVKTGALRSGIKHLRRKNGSTVYMYDPLKRVGGDKLAEWANGMVTFQFTKVDAQRVFQAPQDVDYGKTGILISGKQANWTGERGFFSNAINKNLQQLPPRLQSMMKFTIGGKKI